MRYIQAYIRKNGQAPSIREISKDTKVSPKTVLRDLRTLESEGYISRLPFSHRNIEVIAGPNEEPLETIRVPLVGQAAGGPAILARQNIEDFLDVPTQLIKQHKDVFLLKVKGGSMAPYLENGDLAIVKRAQVAEEGDLVVAVIESDFMDDFEATIKKFHLEKDKVILEPLNAKEWKPMLVDAEKCHIQGIVTGVIKFFKGGGEKSDK